MNRFPVRVLLAVTLIPGFCYAETLSLDEALQRALASNTSIANSKLELEAAGDDVEALRTMRYPRMDVRGGVSHTLEDQSYTFDQGVWGTFPGIGEVPGEDITIDNTDGTSKMWSAGITQPLSQQYRLGLTVEQGEVKEEMAGELVRLTQQDLALVVKQNYFEILQTRNDLVVSNEAILFYQSLTELVSDYVKQDIAFEYELLETEARLARRQLDAATQQNRLATQKEKMNSLLARDLNTAFDVLELPEEVVIPGNQDAAIATALEQRPDILESKLKVKDAELGYDIKKAEYLPDLDLNVRYTRLYDNSLIPDTDAYVGLHAKWEFYDWGRKKNELASKSSMIRKAANSAQQVKDRVTIDVLSSFRAIAEADAGLDVARLSQAAARGKLRVLTNQYREESTLLQNVLDAEKDLDMANNGYNRAVLSVWKAQAGYERAIGEL